MSANDHSRSGIVVIGIGNRFRGDDGVGIIVARLLRQQVPAGIKIIEASGEGAALMDAWKDTANVFIVDAVQSGAPSGTIHQFDAHTTPIPSRFFHYSTHAFGVAEAIELARALNQLPSRLILYGVEGANFSAGVELSAKVQPAADAVIAQLLDATKRLVKAGASPELKPGQIPA